MNCPLSVLCSVLLLECALTALGFLTKGQKEDQAIRDLLGTARTASSGLGAGAFPRMMTALSDAIDRKFPTDRSLFLGVYPAIFALNVALLLEERSRFAAALWLS